MARFASARKNFQIADQAMQLNELLRSTIELLHKQNKDLIWFKIYVEDHAPDVADEAESYVKGHVP